MLTWNKTIRKAQSGKTASEGYTAQIPHWGRASIHPHIHHPGEMFLDCQIGRASGRERVCLYV